MNDKILFINKKNQLDFSNLHLNQRRFIASNKLHTGITGGYQSGKSVAGVSKGIYRLMQGGGSPIAYYLPTYRLIEDMLLPKFDKILTDLGYPYKYLKTESKIITPFGEVWMRSMDNPDRIVSYSVGYSIIDEVDLVHKNIRREVMQRIASRNSFKKDTPNSIDFVSTPEGFAYMYDFFVKKTNDNKALFKLSTLDNSDNLGVGYIDGLKEMYTEKQLQAYLHGDFVNLESGNLYYQFDRFKNNTLRVANEYESLHIGIDFNIGNTNAVIHVIDKNTPYAVDEVTSAYDTLQLCLILKQKYPRNRMIVYPDASGANRSTNADITDIEILKNNGFVVKARKANPLVTDRVKNVNRMFCDGKGIRSYFVNSNNCPLYVEALEKMGYDKNGQPDKASGFDHITDAGGYFIYTAFNPKQRVMIINN